MSRTHARFVAVAALVMLACAAPGTSRPVAAARAFTTEDLATARRLRADALASPLAMELVTSLTTEVGPRLAGTPGDRAAVEWAARRLEALGLDLVRKMEVTVPRWERGTAELAVLEPYPQALPTVALGGSVATPPEGLRASVVAVRDLDELSRLPREAVAGRVVYFSMRTVPTIDGRSYAYSSRTRALGASAAAARGAVAILMRSSGTSANRLPHTGQVVYSIATPRIPALALSNPDGDLLERQLASGRTVTVEMKVTSRELPPAKSANVIAEIPGTDLAEEVVLLGAHLDSWDLGTGALDDGAGVAIVMAAAHLIRDRLPRPRRTIRVVLFANEEFGLSGSQMYALRTEREPYRHVMLLESDLGAGPVYRLDSRVHPGALDVVRQIVDVLRPLGVAAGDNEAMGGADTELLRRAGVPLLAPRLDATRYFEHHHSANDTLDKVDPKALQQSVAAYAVAAYLAARSGRPWEALPAEGVAAVP